MPAGVLLLIIPVFLPLPILVFLNIRGKTKLLAVLAAIFGYFVGVLVGLGLGIEVLKIGWWSILTGIAGGVLGYFILGGLVLNKIDPK